MRLISGERTHIFPFQRNPQTHTNNQTATMAIKSMGYGGKLVCRGPTQLTQVPPTSGLGKARQYTLNQWSKLQVYLTDGRINIDNNRAERAIKPFVIGRKAWLFANTHGGADASAVLYSLVKTAKANDLQPIDYLVSLFEQWPLIKDDDDIDHLLPWNIKISV